MRRRLMALGVFRLTVLWMLVGFGVGALIGLVIPGNPWWYPATSCALSGLALPFRFAIDRHLARTPYDGNDRSRVIPRRQSSED